MSTARLMRSVLEVRPNRWRPGLATLLAIGTALPIVWGVAIHQILLGVLGSIGALYAGLASFGNVHAVRLSRMVTTSIVVAILATIGRFANTSDVATIVCVGVAGVVFSLYGATSSKNSIVGILGTAILIIVSGLPMDDAPLRVGFVVFLGGVLETLLILAMGPLFPRSAERTAVAGAYASLARYVEDFVEGGPVLVPDAGPFHEARARLDEGLAHSPTDEHGFLRHSLRVAETLRAGLVGFARAYRKSSETESLRPIADGLVRDLDDLASAIEQGRYNVLAATASRAMGDQDEPLGRWLKLLAAAFEEAARPPVPGESDPMATLAPRKRWLATLSGLLDSETLRSLTMAHALRFGLAVAVGAAIYRLAHIPLGYWIPLTVAFLLRPDYATTLQKGFARFVGTFGGVVVASVCASVLPPDPIILCGLAIVGGWFAFALYEVSFTLYIGALTFYVVLGITAQGKSGEVVGIERTSATAAGVVLAVIATFLWPVWESSRVRSVLKEAFRAQVAYGESLVRLVHGGAVESGEEHRHRARVLRVEAERLVAASQLEPSWSRGVPVENAREWVEQLDENAAVLLSLHAQALEQRAGRIPDEPQARQTLQHAISEARLMAESLDA